MDISTERGNSGGANWTTWVKETETSIETALRGLDFTASVREKIQLSRDKSSWEVQKVPQTKYSVLTQEERTISLKLNNAVVPYYPGTSPVVRW